MLSKRTRLISSKNIIFDYVSLDLQDPNYIIVKPTYLNICAADQRYYQGKRSAEIMAKKLPMTLIHEAVGEVVYDNLNDFSVGQKVVMVPNEPIEYSKIIKANYLKSSKFRSSTVDGFMQEYIQIRRDRVLKYDNISEKVASLLELLSISVNAIEKFENVKIKKEDVIGIWGTGSVGFSTALLLKYKYPKCKIAIIGNRKNKLQYFQFCDELYTTSDLPVDFEVDHAFECVGNQLSENAINQIIDCIHPQGTISLLGVSEDKVLLNTRMVLEKGITIIGNSRSEYDDFKEAIDILENNNKIQNYLETIISEIIEVKNLADINTAFEKDLTNDFKTIMKWDI